MCVAAATHSRQIRVSVPTELHSLSLRFLSAVHHIFFCEVPLDGIEKALVVVKMDVVLQFACIVDYRIRCMLEKV